LFRGFDALEHQLTRIVIPVADAPLQLDEPGTYTIFHEYRSTIDGRSYAADKITNLIVELHGPNGQSVGLKSNATSNYTMQENAGRSLFDFEARETGTYRLKATYGDRRAEPQTVLAIGRGFMLNLFTMVLTGMAFALGGLATGLGIGITVFI